MGKLTQPIHPPGMASGEIATFHYEKKFTLGFQVHLYEGGKGHAIFKYEIPMGDISYSYDETFKLHARLFGHPRKRWMWIYICKCKRHTYTLFMGKDYSLRCRYCQNILSDHQETFNWEDVLIARDYRKVKDVIRTAHTPHKKMKAVRIYTEFLRVTMRAIRSKKPIAFLNMFKA